MKVFISHQQKDSEMAAIVSNHLRNKHNISCYLDVIDPSIKNGEDLADHLRKQLGTCTQLLAIVSEATKESWWVPWEIGVATEKEYPLATFGNGTKLPEYLMKWPYLQSIADLDIYAQASKSSSAIASLSMESADLQRRHNATKNFYRTLRQALGQ